MKRKLAPEALYSSKSQRSHHHKEPANIPAMERATAESIRKSDPDGKKALTLLKKFA